jgi:FKBP-type peptidyl-prolyl cis-trans isomerase FklB
MKLSRALVVACCLMVSVGCVWAAETKPATPPASAPAATPAPATAPAPAVTAAAAPATSKVEFKTEEEKASYAIGCQIASSLKVQKSFLNFPMLIQGLTDAFNGQSRAMTDDEARQTYAAWQKSLQAKLVVKNSAEAAAFLEANAKKEGVKSLPSGLQYKVLKEGTGNTPAATDKVKVQYRGTLLDGTEFDSSYRRGQPAEFQVRGVIPGWVEALQLMKEGAKWEVYIPPALAYGEGGRPSIPPNSLLVFEVELLEIAKPADPNAAAPTPAVRAPAAAPKAEIKPEVKPQ